MSPCVNHRAMLLSPWTPDMGVAVMATFMSLGIAAGSGLGALVGSTSGSVASLSSPPR